MAHRYIYKCTTCGTSYDFCSKCELVKHNFDKTMFCSKEHSDIFAILSKHGCGLATAEETLEVLESYDTTNVTEGIAKHIESLKEETKREVEHDEPTQE